MTYSNYLCNFMEWMFIIIVAIKMFQYITIGRVQSNVCLSGKTVLITGGNSGMGYETALALAGRGARVIIADKDDATESKKMIIKETHNPNIATKVFDLSSIASIRKFASEINEEEERLDILINNAGTAGLKNTYTKDGIHIVMQVNHFGPFLLTHLLVDKMKKSTPSRIIFVSSLLAFTNNLTTINLKDNADIPNAGLDAIATYGNSKLCNIITANGFAEKLKGTGVTCNSVHPGLVNTPIYQKTEIISGNFKRLQQFFTYNCLLKLYGKSATEGAQTQIHCALANELEGVSGQYFVDCIRFFQPLKTRDPVFCKKIWEQSEELVKLDPSEKLL